VSDAEIRRTQSHLIGAAGHSLLRRAWTPPHPERALLLVHGYGEHSGRYEHVGTWFASRGSAVHAYDQQGHGRSEGPRGHVRRFGDLLDDLERLRQATASEHPGLPLYLLGHSMGGLVVTAFACERQPRVAGAVTSGAALALAQGVARGRLLAARLLRRLAPRLAFPAGLDLDGLSRDPEVVRAYVEDPLVHDRVTLSLGAELSAAIARTARSAARVKLPMLMLHGEDDTLCPARGTREFFAGLETKGSALRVYPGLRHEIFNEPERESVFRDVLEWLQDAPGRA